MEDAVHLQALRPYVAHVRVADAVQVVVVSSARHVAEERPSRFHLGEHVVVIVPSHRAHVCAERQCVPHRRFPDALEFLLLGVLVQNASSACTLHRSRLRRELGLWKPEAALVQLQEVRSFLCAKRCKAKGHEAVLIHQTAAFETRRLAEELQRPCDVARRIAALWTLEAAVPSSRRTPCFACVWLRNLHRACPGAARTYPDSFERSAILRPEFMRP